MAKQSDGGAPSPSRISPEYRQEKNDQPTRGATVHSVQHAEGQEQQSKGLHVSVPAAPGTPSTAAKGSVPTTHGTYSVAGKNRLNFWTTDTLSPATYEPNQIRLHIPDEMMLLGDDGSGGRIVYGFPMKATPAQREGALKKAIAKRDQSLKQITTDVQSQKDVAVETEPSLPRKKARLSRSDEKLKRPTTGKSRHRRLESLKSADYDLDIDIPSEKPVSRKDNVGKDGNR